MDVEMVMACEEGEQDSDNIEGEIEIFDCPWGRHE